MSWLQDLWLWAITYLSSYSLSRTDSGEALGEDDTRLVPGTVSIGKVIRNY